MPVRAVRTVASSQVSVLSRSLCTLIAAAKCLNRMASVPSSCNANALTFTTAIGLAVQGA